jgi:hypothetical protein
MMLFISFGSFVTGGHAAMMGYRDSGKMGSGRSRKNFLSSTAARLGSPKVSRETTLPEEGLRML